MFDSDSANTVTIIELIYMILCSLFPIKWHSTTTSDADGWRGFKTFVSLSLLCRTFPPHILKWSHCPVKYLKAPITPRLMFHQVDLIYEYNDIIYNTIHYKYFPLWSKHMSALFYKVSFIVYNIHEFKL
jgi:hypothetical protein